MNACLKRQGLDLVVVSASTIPYSPENHRTLIALRCAANMRPYNSVQDPLYAAEVEMLRPGTKLPDPTTVSRDVQLLYQEISKCVCQYFKVWISWNVLFGILCSSCGRILAMSSILLLMDGLHQLLHHFLVWFLYGLSKERYIALSWSSLGETRQSYLSISINRF